MTDIIDEEKLQMISKHGATPISFFMLK